MGIMDFQDKKIIWNFFMHMNIAVQAPSVMKGNIQS
jgi:hypothetical protein